MELTKREETAKLTINIIVELFIQSGNPRVKSVFPPFNID